MKNDVRALQNNDDIARAVRVRADRRVDVVKVMASGGMTTAGTDVLGKFYEVFLRYGNGAKEIGADAIFDKGLDQSTVLTILDAFDDQAPQTERDWSKATLAELAAISAIVTYGVRGVSFFFMVHLGYQVARCDVEGHAGREGERISNRI